MDAYAHAQGHPSFLRQAGIELAQGLHHPQPGPHCPLRVILMRLRIAEVDEQAIAEILGDMALKAGDHLGAGVLIGPHHFAPVFGVELAGQHGRVHQVTEQHRELAAFGIRRMRGGSVASGSGQVEQQCAMGWARPVLGWLPPVQTSTRPSSSSATCWA